MSASGRYGDDVVAELRAIEDQERKACPRAFALSEMLHRLIREMDPRGPVLTSFESLQLMMLSALDHRKDVSEECERAVLAAIDAARTR